MKDIEIKKLEDKISFLEKRVLFLMKKNEESQKLMKQFKREIRKLWERK